MRGPATIQVFRDPDIGLGITDVNTRFGGAFPAPVYAALPGRTYPELIVAHGRRRAHRAPRRRVPHGMTFTRYYWQLELDERAAARPGARSSRAARRRRASGARDGREQPVS